MPACLWGTLTGSHTGAKVFQFIYFFSSFWNQFGPNCTTFLVAGEPLLCMLYLVTLLYFQIKAWLDASRAPSLQRRPGCYGASVEHAVHAALLLYYTLSFVKLRLHSFACEVILTLNAPLSWSLVTSGCYVWLHAVLNVWLLSGLVVYDVLHLQLVTCGCLGQGA